MYNLPGVKQTMIQSDSDLELSLLTKLAVTLDDWRTETRDGHPSLTDETIKASICSVLVKLLPAAIFPFGLLSDDELGQHIDELAMAVNNISQATMSRVIANRG